MKNSEERRIQNQFGAFCTRVLKNEALRIEAEYSRISDREKTFNELSECNRRWAAAADAVTNGRPAVVAAGQFNRSLSA